MGIFQFSAVLIRPERTGTWTYFNLPLEVSDSLGKKGQVKVKGTVNGQAFRGSAMPHGGTGSPRHYVVVNQSVRDAAGVTQGDTVEVTLEIDTEPRAVTVPEDFSRALEADPPVKTLFDGLSYSHRREYVEWIEAARQAATRQRRIDSALKMLREGKTPKSRPKKSET